MGGVSCVWQWYGDAHPMFFTMAKIYGSYCPLVALISINWSISRYNFERDK